MRNSHTTPLTGSVPTDGGTITESQRVVATDDQVSTTVEQEEVVLHLETGTYYGLDGVGSRIWELLEEPRTVRDVVDTIVTEFDVDRETALEETTEFLAELEDENLIDVE